MTPAAAHRSPSRPTRPTRLLLCLCLLHAEYGSTAFPTIPTPCVVPAAPRRSAAVGVAAAGSDDDGGSDRRGDRGDVRSRRDVLRGIVGAGFAAVSAARPGIGNAFDLPGFPLSATENRAIEGMPVPKKLGGLPGKIRSVSRIMVRDRRFVVVVGVCFGERERGRERERARGRREGRQSAGSGSFGQKKKSRGGVASIFAAGRRKARSDASRAKRGGRRRALANTDDRTGRDRRRFFWKRRRETP